MWVGCAVAAAGLVGMLVGVIPLREHSYWVGYFKGMRGAGALALFFGLAVAGLAAAHLYTHFFDLKRRMSANKFGISIAVVIIVTGLLAVTVPSELPTTSKERLLKQDPKMRAKTVHDEKRLKRMTAAMILVAGGVIAFYPSRRFFRR